MPRENAYYYLHPELDWPYPGKPLSREQIISASHVHPLQGSDIADFFQAQLNALHEHRYQSSSSREGFTCIDDLIPQQLQVPSRNAFQRLWEDIVGTNRTRRTP